MCLSFRESTDQSQGPAMKAAAAGTPRARATARLAQAGQRRDQRPEGGDRVGWVRPHRRQPPETATIVALTYLAGAVLA